MQTLTDTPKQLNPATPTRPGRPPTGPTKPAPMTPYGASHADPCGPPAPTPSMCDPPLKGTGRSQALVASALPPRHPRPAPQRWSRYVTPRSKAMEAQRRVPL